MLKKFGYDASYRNGSVVCRRKTAATLVYHNDPNGFPVRRNVAHSQGLIENEAEKFT